MRKSATKLRDAMSATGLVTDLAVAVAHQREEVIFGNDFRDRPLKIVGNIHDRCQVRKCSNIILLRQPLQKDKYTVKVVSRKLWNGS